MVGSSLKCDNWIQSKSLHLGRHFFHLLTPPRFGALNRKREFSGSQPVNRKLFPYGPHSSKNNVLKLRYPGQRPYRLPLFPMRSKVDLSIWYCCSRFWKLLSHTIFVHLFNFFFLIIISEYAYICLSWGFELVMTSIIFHLNANFNRE